MKLWGLFIRGVARNAVHMTCLPVCCLMLLIPLQTVRAQTLDGPLHLVVGYAAGGATDRVARIVAEKLQSTLGIAVVVDNKPGAGGRLAAQVVKNTPANQNVLMLGNPAVMVVAPLVFKDNGYDADKDFAPVSLVNNYLFAIAVGSAVPVTSIKELTTWLSQHPEQANVGVPATGSLPHFFALMVGEAAHVKTQVVGYKGSAPLLTDLLGGAVPVACDTFETMEPYIAQGKLHVLAVSGAERSAFAPQVPTFKEAGLDLMATGWNAFFAPRSMPLAKQAMLAKAIEAAMQDPEVKKKFADAKLTPVSAGQQQTEAMLVAFKKQWAPVVQRSGYQP